MALNGIIKSWTVPNGTVVDLDGSGVKRNISGAYYSFEWSATKNIEAGKTDIIYNIYRRGRNSSPTLLRNQLQLKVVDQNGIEHININDSNPGTSFNDDLYSSGSFTITHQEDGTASFSVDFNVNIAIGVFFATSENATLEINYPYTKCLAPSLIEASGIIAPNGTFSISWSGASGGNSNDIIGYEIYYRITKEGELPTINLYTDKISIGSNSNSGTKTITVSGATRGHIIKCAILTKGQAGKNYDSDLGIGGTVIINSLPNMPDINVSSTVVPSFGGKIEFTIKAGIDIDANQSVSCYYNIENNTETAIQINSENFISDIITSNQTFYFWSYDGLEFGAAKTINIKVNSKPTIKSFTSTGAELFSINSVKDYHYVISPNIIVEPGENGYISNTYSYGVYYGSSISNLTENKIIANNQFSNFYSINDIRLIIDTDQTEARYYQLYAKRNDGIEESEILRDSTIYYVTKRPNFLQMFNKNYSENFENFEESFLNELSVDLDLDDGYSSLILESNDVLSLSSQLLQKNSSQMYSNFSTNHLVNFIRGREYSFNLIVQHDSGYNFKIVAPNDKSTTRFRIYKPILENLIFPSSVKPFDTSNKTISLYNWFGEQPTDVLLKQYGMSSSLENIFIYLSDNDVTGEILKFSPLLNNIDYYGNTINLTLTSQQFYNLLPSSINKNVVKQLKINISVTNVFEQETSLYNLNSSFSADFREKIQLIEQGLYIGDGDSTNTSNIITNWEFLKESMPIVYSGKWLSYNSNPFGQIYIKRSYKEYDSSQPYGEPYGQPFYLIYESGTLGPGLPLTYSISNNIIQTIGQILQEDYTASFSIVINSDANLQESVLMYSECPVRGHKNALINLNKANYNDDKTISFEYQIIEDGISENSFEQDYISTIGGLQLRSSDQNFNTDKIIWGTSKLILTSNSNKISYNEMVGKNIIFIRLQLELSLYTKRKDLEEEAYTTTYTSYSNELAVYNILPTVAYRQNHLGINLTDFTDLKGAQLKEVVLAIGEYSGRNTIYLKGSDHISKINIKDGTIENFVIDGGTW